MLLSRLHVRMVLSLAVALAAPYAQAEDFLSADEAFAFSSSRSDTLLEWHWRIAPGYSLYRDRIHVKVLEPATVQLTDPVMPPALIHSDEFFGPQAVYTGDLLLSTRLHCTVTTATTVQVEVRYQGCADAGLCYPPEVRTIALSLDPALCQH